MMGRGSRPEAHYQSETVNPSKPYPRESAHPNNFETAFQIALVPDPHELGQQNVRFQKSPGLCGRDLRFSEFIDGLGEYCRFCLKGTVSSTSWNFSI